MTQTPASARFRPTRRISQTAVVHFPMERVFIHKDAFQKHHKLVTAPEAAVLMLIHNGESGELNVVDYEERHPDDPSYITTSIQAERERLKSLYGAAADRPPYVNEVFGVPANDQMHLAAITGEPTGKELDTFVRGASEAARELADKAVRGREDITREKLDQDPQTADAEEDEDDEAEVPGDFDGEAEKPGEIRRERVPRVDTRNTAAPGPKPKKNGRGRKPVPKTAKRLAPGQAGQPGTGTANAVQSPTMQSGLQRRDGTGSGADDGAGRGGHHET